MQDDVLFHQLILSAVDIGFVRWGSRWKAQVVDFVCVYEVGREGVCGGCNNFLIFFFFFLEIVVL